MNIFFLHEVPIICAGQHADVHLGKMLLESCQMLATAHHLHGNGAAVTYKPAHPNHPCTKWVAESRLHYMYLSDLADHLGRRFRLRFGKDHASHDTWHKELQECPPALKAAPHKWRNPPLAMPDEFKSDDAVESYKRYYASKADTMEMKWGNDLPPFWFTLLRNEMERA
jgi:hypothetical protein